jgi:hypothetical protein
MMVSEPTMEGRGMKSEYEEGAGRLGTSELKWEGAGRGVSRFKRMMWWKSDIPG